MMDRLRIKRSTRRGSSLIEFGIVSFTLMVMVFGMFEFCRMGLVYTDLCDASRVAVRYAITHGSDRSTACGSGAGCGTSDQTASSSSICGASGVLTSYALGPLNTSNLSCSYAGLGGGPGSTVQVTVSYAYDPWFNIAPFKVTLSSTSEGVITY